MADKSKTISVSSSKTDGKTPSDVLSLKELVKIEHIKQLTGRHFTTHFSLIGGYGK